MITYPSTLPPPQRPSLKVVAGTNLVRRETQSGRIEIRKFGVGAPDKITIKFHLKTDEIPAFKWFFERETNLGINWFSASWLPMLGYQDHKIRFLNYPRTVVKTAHYHILSATFIVQETAFCPVDTFWPTLGTGGEPPIPPTGDIVQWGTAFPTPPITKAVKVTAGYKWALAIDENNQLVGWGTNFSTWFAGTYEHLIGVVGIFGLNASAICLLDNGTIAVVGLNISGLYDNIPAFTDIVNVATTINKYIVVRADGSMHYGGSPVYPAIPAGLSAPDYIQSCGQGKYGFFAVKDGSAYLWNQYVQYGLPQTQEIHGQNIICGLNARYWACYFTNTGSYHAWGTHQWAGNPPTGLMPKLIKGSLRTCIAVHEDDTVHGWSGSYNPTNPPGLKVRDITYVPTGWTPTYIAITL